MTSVTLTFDLWPWPSAWTPPLSMVITPEISWQYDYMWKGVTDRQTDGRTDARMERSVLRAARSQLKSLLKKEILHRMPGHGTPGLDWRSQPTASDQVPDKPRLPRYSAQIFIWTTRPCHNTELPFYGTNLEIPTLFTSTENAYMIRSECLLRAWLVQHISRIQIQIPEYILFRYGDSTNLVPQLFVCYEQRTGNSHTWCNILISNMDWL